LGGTSNEKTLAILLGILMMLALASCAEAETGNVGNRRRFRRTNEITGVVFLDANETASLIQMKAGSRHRDQRGEPLLRRMETGRM
jgi:hypothetical protein